ncbi:metalloregulator ArsR/SmtB family transcription factor [Devosia sp. 919]|uniref:ArsR/SmtB family transcription factor n=1 Tax=Devosia sp. 919 TaxID=2726065 RepID=UPI00155815E0|nr:metalloregulator ArsR/SmtB family transcription factor [Devosia sp. 919]
MLNQDDQLDQIYRALADPTRRAVVERLTAGSATVSELAEPFDMSLPGLTQHLRVLEDAGLVQTQKVGRVRTCTLDLEVLGSAERWINQRRQAWAQRFDRLGALLAEDDEPSPPTPSKGRDS